MAKPEKIDLIFQLILDNCVLKTLETLLFGLRKIFGVACSTPILALLSRVSHNTHFFENDGDDGGDLHGTPKKFPRPG